MKENQNDQRSLNSDSQVNQPTPEINEDIQKKIPGVIEPDNNDPTRDDKPPLIISKL